MTKLRNEKDFPHFNYDVTKNGGKIHIDTRHAVLREYKIWTGATCIDGAFVGFSLRSKSDRMAARRFANKLLDVLGEDE